MAEQKPQKKRTILIAMDASKHSDNAFQWYVDNLHKSTDEVILTHCAETFHLQPTDLLGANETSVDELYKSTAEKSKSIVRHIDELAKKHQISHRNHKLTGFPGHAIVKAAEDVDASMIICGSRGQGLLRRTMMGSVSDYVLHHAHMPVIVCKHEDEQKILKRQSSRTN